MSASRTSPGQSVGPCTFLGRVGPLSPHGHPSCHLPELNSPERRGTDPGGGEEKKAGFSGNKAPRRSLWQLHTAPGDLICVGENFLSIYHQLQVRFTVTFTRPSNPFGGRSCLECSIMFSREPKITNNFPACCLLLEWEFLYNSLSRDAHGNLGASCKPGW